VRRRESTHAWSADTTTPSLPRPRRKSKFEYSRFVARVRFHARVAQSALMGPIAVADLVKTTLGPKGMDKILQPMGGPGTGRGVTFTNDGATILKSIPVDNPAAKIVVDTSKTQDIEVGDGTTSVAVLTGELLREAEKLIAQKLHPQLIIRGYRKAVTVAREALLSMSLDHSADPVAFRQDLINIAETTLSSKILSSCKQHFAELAVDAILRLKGNTDLSCIQIVKKVGGSMQDSYLEKGFVLDKKIGVGQPKRIENARILVANTALDTDKIKIFGARVRVDGVEKLAEIEQAEKEKMKNKVNKILKHDCNVFISRQLIYNFPEQVRARAQQDASVRVQHTYEVHASFCSLIVCLLSCLDLHRRRCDGDRARRLRGCRASGAGARCRDHLHVRPPGAGQAGPLRSH
jgi:T-complex protein 1 subunit beta